VTVYRFTADEWLTHMAATLEVTGSRPSFDDFSEIHFLESIQPAAQRDLKWYMCDIAGIYCDL